MPVQRHRPAHNVAAQRKRPPRDTSDRRARPTASSAPHVLQAISNVMAAVAKEGIAKERRADGDGSPYQFRSIDDVYNRLCKILAEQRLVITPRCLARQCIERRSASGAALFYVTVDVEFTLASARDGSSITAKTVGEALDTGDKATNKAMSAAFKYMAMQTFCIPTRGDNDADVTTYVVKSDACLLVGQAKAAIDACGTAAELKIWRNANERALDELPGAAVDDIIRHFNAQVARVKSTAPVDHTTHSQSHSRLNGYAVEASLPSPNAELQA